MAFIIATYRGASYSVEIDDDDYGKLIQYTWYVSKRGYVWRSGKMTCGVREPHVLMHRQIMGSNPNDGLDVDHVNGNKLDNRRMNLRRVKRSDNIQNSRGHKDRKDSTERGVSFHRMTGKWRAEHMFRGRRWSQLFETEGEAATAVRARRHAVLGYETTIVEWASAGSLPAMGAA